MRREKCLAQIRRRRPLQIEARKGRVAAHVPLYAEEPIRAKRRHLSNHVGAILYNSNRLSNPIFGLQKMH